MNIVTSLHSICLCKLTIGPDLPQSATIIAGLTDLLFNQHNVVRPISHYS